MATTTTNDTRIMTTNKPEVVAYLHTNKENPGHRGVSLYHDSSCTSTLTNTEPLIRLRDYEALQAKCDALMRFQQDSLQRWRKIARQALA